MSVDNEVNGSIAFS